VRASRLLSILILLQMRGRMSAEALAAEFEVSVRTIYRDIDELSAAGVPVYAERGRAGGFELMDGYRTRLTGFTQAEAEALLLAGVGGAARDLGLGGELAMAELKLLASLPPDAGASAQRVAQRFHLDSVNWYRRAEPADLLPAIAAAVWSDRRIRVRYESWKDIVERTLCPLGLVLKAGAWYLVALAEGQARTYRVSNIQELSVAEESFERPRKFDLARYWRLWARDFEARLLRERAVVKLSPAGLKLLRDVSEVAAEAAESSKRPCRPDGWIRAEIPIEGVEHAARQLLRLGADAQVLEPEALRERVAAHVRALADLYAGGRSTRPLAGGVKTVRRSAQRLKSNDRAKSSRGGRP
jgi:predicted DNA-binding transcriptional regulator YafY